MIWIAVKELMLTGRWYVEVVVFFVYKDSLLLLNFIVRKWRNGFKMRHIELVYDLLSLLRWMLPKFTYMFEKFVTHAHSLLIIIISRNDITPVVLKLQIPSFFLLLVIHFLKRIFFVGKLFNIVKHFLYVNIFFLSISITLVILWLWFVNHNIIIKYLFIVLINFFVIFLLF